MRRPLLQTCAALLTASACRSWAAQTDPSHAIKWVVFYGPSADDSVLSAYDIVILDTMFQGSIPAIAKAGARVCGYLSLGEIKTSDSYFPRLNPAALLESNPEWPGTRRIDIRQQSWKELVLGEMVPSLISQGFTGFMLDTLDTPPYLEQLDPIRNRGMRQAAVDLVRAIRTAYPRMLVIMNRGYALLPSIIASIDYIVAESLLTRPGLQQAQTYEWNEPAEVALQMTLLAPATHRQPVLPVLSLDYWDPADTTTIGEIYRREQQLGHNPYVATRMLDTIVPAPRR
jgi:uncharacterized protein (TIGR01370 family)